MNYFGLINYIKQEMKKQGITQTKLASQMGTDVRVLNNYLKLRRTMPADRLVEILDLLGLEIKISRVERVDEV